MPHYFRRSLALLLCLSALPVFSWADFRADFAASGATDNAMSRLELAGSRVRTDAGTISMLMDTASGKMIILMHDKRQFMDMQKLADTAGAAMSAASAALANLPPEQRAMIEEKMGAHLPGAGAAAASVSMTATPATDKVAGYPCQIYRTDIGSRHAQDSCLANVSAAGISGTDQATLRRAFEQLKQLTQKMSAGMFKSPLAEMPVNRFPVKLTRFDDSGKANQTVVLTSITSGLVPAADFSIPAGYTEQDMTGMGRHH